MKTPELGQWPTDELESVPLCPVCGGDERDLVHHGLVDDTFSSAPGAWDLWRCRSCRSGWLDPRPDSASIGRAYSNYFTHKPAAGSTDGAELDTLRHRLGNGYRNRRFGTRLEPASPLGPLAARLIPHVRRRIDDEYRMLPRRVGKSRPTLLDVGCGNGGFLQVAQKAGWECIGTEPDPIARKSAQSLSFDVRESLCDFEAAASTVDYVTMSHVIEHVHSPSSVLAAVHGLLVRGGGIYIATPNMDAIGHGLYGSYWRGLETPRHLVIFTRQGLDGLLRQSGFSDLEFHPCPGALQFTSVESRRIAASHFNEGRMTDLGRRPTRSELRLAERPGPHSEFLIVTGRRA